MSALASVFGNIKATALPPGVDTAAETAAFHKWLREHPTPESRYARKQAHVFTLQLEKKGDEENDDDNDEEFPLIASNPTPAQFLHCTVRGIMAEDQRSQAQDTWDLHCYEFGRISWRSLLQLCTTDDLKAKHAAITKTARHGDVLCTTESEYRGVSYYYFYGTPCEIAGGECAVIKSGREFGESPPPEFYDAPIGFFSNVADEGGLRTVSICDVVPPPAYLVRCAQYDGIVALWRRAVGILCDSASSSDDDDDDDDSDDEMRHVKKITIAQRAAMVEKETLKAVKRAGLACSAAHRNPDEDPFLIFAEEDGDDSVIALPARPRSAVHLRELMLVPAAVESPLEWFRALTDVERVGVFAREAGARRDRDDDDNNNAEKDEDSPKKKPAAKAKKAASKKAAAAAAASSSSSSSSSDDDDDADAAKKGKPAPKKKAAAKKAAAAAKKGKKAQSSSSSSDDDDADADAAKKADDANAGAGEMKWQFRADLDADSDDDAAWADYAADVSAKLETQYTNEWKNATPAQQKTKKRNECGVSATHTVHFAHMIQAANADFNRQRAVRRVAKK